MSKAYNIATSFLAYQNTFTDYPNQLNIGTANVTTLNADDSITANTATISAVNTTDINSSNNATLKNLKMSSSSHEWTIKGIDFAISDNQSGVSPDITDADSGQLSIYNGTTKLWGITEHGYVTQPKMPYVRAYMSGQANYDVTTGQPEVTIPYNNAVDQVGNCYDTINYRFTCPIIGAYQIHATVQVSEQNTTGWGFNFGIYANGSRAYGVYETGDNTNYQKVDVNFTIRLNAGDYIDIRIINENGATPTYEFAPGDSRNCLSIMYLG